MNSAKRTIKEQNKKKSKKPLAESGGMGKRIAGGILLGILAVVIIVIGWEGFAPKYLMSINGNKLKQKDLVHEIFETEMMGVSMADLYAQLGYTENYWTMMQGNGQSTQEISKEQVIEQAEETYILYEEAIKAGYEITPEEKEEAEKTADENLEVIGEAKMKKLGITREDWIRHLERSTLAYRYRDDMVAEFDIDEEAIKAGIDYESFRGYEVEYFFIPTTTQNAEGETVDVEDKQTVYKELEAVLAKAKGSDDWSEIVDSEDETETVTYRSDTFTRQDEGFREETMNAIFAMENGAVSDIMEEDDGYYVFLMKNNNSSEEYDDQVKDAITAEEEERFDEYFEALKSEQYKVKIYDNNWKSVVFGTVTI